LRDFVNNSPQSQFSARRQSSKSSSDYTVGEPMR
jgi:hypothetical protein